MVGVVRFVGFCALRDGLQIDFIETLASVLPSYVLNPPARSAPYTSQSLMVVLVETSALNSWYLSVIFWK